MVKKDRGQQEHFTDSPEASGVLQGDESAQGAGNEPDVVFRMVDQKLPDSVDHPRDGQKFKVLGGRVEIKYGECNIRQGIALFAQVVSLARSGGGGKSMEKED